MSQSVSEILLEIFAQYAPQQLITNLNATVMQYEVQGKSIITTRVDDRVENNCYVVSPSSLMIDFAFEERVKLKSKGLRLFTALLITSLSRLLTLAKVDQIQTLNNYMLSTNFFPEEFSELTFLQELTDKALQTLPQHAVAVRCINARLHQELLQQLQELGYDALVTRQVYIYDDFERVQHHKNYRRDRELLNSDRYIFEKPDLTDLARFERAENLYNQLYLDKYSQLNVQFKALYLRDLMASGLLHLRLLRDREQNQDVAVVGLMGEGGVITAPVVGYDFSYSRRQALYRRVIAYAIEYAHKEGYSLNLSSGASDFKRNRGAIADLEYMLVYTQHLVWHRRVIWSGLAWLSSVFYGRLLKKYLL